MGFIDSVDLYVIISDNEIFDDLMARNVAGKVLFPLTPKFNLNHRSHISEAKLWAILNNIQQDK